ncbi:MULTISPECIES: ABC transporter ATP-binding protein [unclassified Streptosporangium]|uniref:ABC transporter ATP-binding protein n=1 Tax=unclassified Streptosporangium TaxID=2632669 RepID=UPI002E28AC65|nr:MULTISPECIES: ABC transporter ATP-binding protein [unclassified Streptosporangium]
MEDIAVRVRGLTKRYGDVQAVGGIDLDIRAGEVFAILGPNGAGKSTTVEIMEGHRTRDAGEVSVLGVDPGRPTRAWRSRIGIVLQTANDVAEATVRETVRHFAGYYPGAKDPDEVIELVGLTEKADQRIRKLSGGQRRRVDVALGVIGNPELLFLDEPTTGFDPEARRQFWELIEGLTRDGTTIVLTTHYLDEAEALANRVAVVAGGRIVAEGEPKTLGGRATAKAVVSWSDAGERHSLETDTPTRTVLELTRRFDGEVPELAVTRPTLEDVYLRLIETPA